jgi:hypothetical protein
LTMALLAVAAFFVIRFLMKRFGGGLGTGLGGGQKPALAGMGAAGGMGTFQHAPGSANDIAARNNMLRTAEPTPAVTPFQNPTPASFDGGLNSTPAAATRNHVPADFDSPGFERIAKMIFIRMQTANDAADLNDLRNFTTPEMFASVRLELQETARSSACVSTA